MLSLELTMSKNVIKILTEIYQAHDQKLENKIKQFETEIEDLKNIKELLIKELEQKIKELEQK